LQGKKLYFLSKETLNPLQRKVSNEGFRILKLFFIEQLSQNISLMGNKICMIIGFELAEK
jgi:hypothetical protein